jgi:hypothetical protein
VAGTTIGREKGRYAVSPSEVPEHGQAWAARALGAHDGWEMVGLGHGGRPVAVGCQKKNLAHPEGTAFRASPREIMCTETRLKKALYHVLKHCTPLSMGDVKYIASQAELLGHGRSPGYKDPPHVRHADRKTPPGCWLTVLGATPAGEPPHLDPSRPFGL